jgi:hypothetical protein
MSFAWLPDVLGPFYWVISGIFAVTAAWFGARFVWRDQLDEPLETNLLLVVIPLMAGGVTFLAWQLFIVIGAVAGVFWLFAQAAKPGRIELPRRKRLATLDDWERATMQARITELEAELGIAPSRERRSS